MPGQNSTKIFNSIAPFKPGGSQIAPKSKKHSSQTEQQGQRYACAKQMAQPQTAQKRYGRSSQESPPGLLGTHAGRQFTLSEKLTADLTETVKNGQHQKGKKHPPPLQRTIMP